VKDKVSYCYSLGKISRCIN